MGLDITYARRAEFLGSGDEFDNEDAWFVYPDPDWPERADGLREGYYKLIDSGSFRAGSYSGYNVWREMLAEMALDMTPEEVWALGESADDRPFYELIDFSDCEGVFGPATCKALLHDFDTYNESAKCFLPTSGFYEKYRLWHQAFRVAAESGLVIFH